MNKDKDLVQKYLDIAGVIILTINAEQKVTLVNKKGCEVLGYTESEIIGKNWFDNFIPERIRHQVMTVFEKLMSGETKSSEYFENPVLTKSGEERIIAWHNTVLTDEKNNVIGTLSSGNDVTELKKNEEETRNLLAVLSKAKTEWEMTFDSVMEIISLVDKEFTIVRCNKSFAEFAGRPVTEMIGRKFYDLFPWKPEETEYYRELIKSAAHSEWIEIKLKTGQWFYVSQKSISDDKGDFMFSVIIATDITALKNAQEMVIESQEELKKRIEDLERFYEMAVGRELKMKELKREIKKLNEEISRYKAKEGL